MATITARTNQSMQDVVLTAYGTLEAAVAFCVANGVAISDTPVPGTVYVVPDGPTDRKVLATWAANGTVPATLALPPCGIITGIAVGEVTATTAVVTFTLPDEGIGWEWAITTSSETPTEGAAGEGDGVLELTELEPETNYYVWLRTVCVDNYSSWRSARVRTAVAEELGLTMVLNPRMRGEASTDLFISTVTYTLLPKVGDAPDYEELFVHEYELLEDWIATPVVKYQGLLAYQSDPGGVGSTTLSAVAGTMGTKTATFTTIELAGASIFWSELDEDVLTLTYEDVAGNRALCCPVMLGSGGGVWTFFIAEISVQVVRATDESVQVRIRRQHVANDGFPPTMTWARDAMGGTPDPDDVHNDDITIKTFTAGTYELAVRTTYSGMLGELPMSVVTCIITIG